MIRPCRQQSYPGFSLVELLVTISVVAVLVGLLFPALRGAIMLARSAICRSNLRQLGLMHAIWSESHHGAWLNLYADNMEAEHQSYAADGVSFYFPDYGQQCDIWLLGLLDHTQTPDGYVLDSTNDYEAYSCPVVYRDEIGLPEGGLGRPERPHFFPLSSYYYTPTLVTTPDLWDPRRAPIDADEIRNDQRQLVRTSDVRFPSAKVSMAERADYHTSFITAADEPETKTLNALFADGHAGRVRLEGIASPVSTIGFGFDGLFGMVGTAAMPRRVPFRSTPDGYLGRDVSP